MTDFSERCALYPNCFCGWFGLIDCRRPIIAEVMAAGEPAAVVPFVDRQGVAHFVCVDCGVEVHHFGPAPAEACCATCLWLRDPNLSAEDRVKLKALLNV